MSLSIKRNTPVNQIQTTADAIVSTISRISIGVTEVAAKTVKAHLKVTEAASIKINMRRSNIKVAITGAEAGMAPVARVRTSKAMANKNAEGRLCLQRVWKKRKSRQRKRREMIAQCL